jgi:HicA toxin of bacterial toxin-antitoxin,
MNSKQAKTLKAIFTDPVLSDIAWKDIVKLFEALGATVSQGKGSRVRVLLNEQRAVFHEPHPERVTDKGAVKSVREFLANAGIKAD